MRSATCRRWITAWSALVVGTIGAAGAMADESAAPPAVDFAAQVQPILVQHCQKCHGQRKQESGLRLDSAAAALKGGEGGYGPTLVPGKSADSVLIQAVTGAHADLEQMPPGDTKLGEAEVAVLRAWIDQGAIWPADDGAASPKKNTDHWAFKSPVKPNPPGVAADNWPRNAIDRFVLARLEAEQLGPSPEADRVTQLRRLHLDLVGLPPTIEQVDAFLADERPDAYERQVERLLQSPNYGERWGRHWLDAARYADSDGYEKDKSRNVWFYRDWVVAAMNRDLPYDQFLIEQLAGDLLPGATQDQRVATGFLRNSMLNEEGGVDPEQFRMDAMFDRMDAIGKSILGLTIQCGQCHSHKYDPFSQEEYYMLFAYLNSDHEPSRVVYSPDEMRLCQQLTGQMQAIDEQLKEQTPDWAERLAVWEQAQQTQQPDWNILEPHSYLETGGGAKLSLLADQSMLCAGYAPTHCTFQVVGPTDLKTITGVRLELNTNPNLPAGGPGRSFKGTCALTEIKVEIASATEPDKKTSVKLTAATADYSQPESPLEPNFDDRSGKKKIVGPVAYAIDGKDETAWAIDAGPGRRNQDRTAVFALEKPAEFPDGAIVTVSLVQNHGGWNSDDHQNNLLGCFRVSVTGAAAPTGIVPLARRTRQLLTIPTEQRAPAQMAEVFAHWRGGSPEFSEPNERIEDLWRKWPAGATTLVLEARDEARATHVLNRGDFLKPKHEVAAGTPAFLHPLEVGAPTSRLTLARWLADRRSPTTARVIVNRIWQAYFGAGLVLTSEDFGVQSPPASHPELLDWLACELMDRGWSLKELHRLIVGSAVYRQSSRVAPEMLERDPQNRLLARGPRVRVEAEIVRDIALSASGLLTTRFGGPSVYPPIPESLLALSYGPMTWNAETGADRYRRALYTFRRRSIPFPVLQNFDTPNGDFSCVRRTRSNTPLQALTTLNEVVSMECAQALARLALTEGGPDDNARIECAFRRCLSRRPDAEELAHLRALLAEQLARIAEGWINPWQIAGGKDGAPAALPAGVTPAQLAGYTVVARVILNLDETITKE